MHPRNRQQEGGCSPGRAMLELSFAVRIYKGRRPVFRHEHGLPLCFFCAGIRARFGAQIPAAGVQPMCLVLVRFIEGGRNLGLVSCPESGLQNAPGFRHRKIKNRSSVVQQICSCGAARLIASLPQHGPNFGLSMSRSVHFATSTTRCGSGRAARD